MIIVDVETTGVHPEKHAILSIGAVDFSHPEKQFYEECYIWEGAQVMQEGEEGLNGALLINGFTEENIRDKNKNSQKEIIEKFYAWVQTCEEQTFAGQNISFDLGFLTATAKREGINWYLKRRSIDLHTLAYAEYLKKSLPVPININLDTTLVYVGLPEEPKPHHALTGAKLEAEAFSRIIYGKKLIKEFKQLPIPDYLIQNE